jgi:23S rRNA (guanosine2251-2'-O)-methyltransferase
MKLTARPYKKQCLYGIHPIKEALIANKRKITQIFVNQKSRNARLAEIVALASEVGIDISYVSSTDLFRIAQHKDHQQVVAHVSSLPLIDFQVMISSNAFIVICDQIMDPHNMGAIMRTALASGATGLITTQNNSTSLSATVSKISSGAMEHLPIARVTNLVRCIKALKNSGVWVFGLDSCATLSIYDAQFSGKIALVIGSEHKGIRRLIAENCDHVLQIPQVGQLESLNASVAAGVAMYEVFRQRNYSGGIV